MITLIHDDGFYYTDTTSTENYYSSRGKLFNSLKKNNAE